MPNNGCIPHTFSRSLMLALQGYVYRNGRWHYPTMQTDEFGLSEEDLDGLSARQWQPFVDGWLLTATSEN